MEKKMSERTETCQLVVTNAGEFGDEEFQFTFQAVDGEVLLGCNVRTYVAGSVNLQAVAPVALTTSETVKFIRRLLDVHGEACKQEGKSK